MSAIIQRGERVSATSHQRGFHWAHMPGAGFGFPCDESGKLDNLNDAASANYAMCLLGHDEHGKQIIDDGIVSWTNSWYEPPILKCDCGNEFSLDCSAGSDVTQCSKCGADYNAFGQRLAPREQWGEETGETWQDILYGQDDAW